MNEKIYFLDQGNQTKVEKLVMKSNGQYLHMLFNQGDGLPIHMSNAELFMTVLKGRLSLGLNDQKIHKHEKGTMIQIPFKTKMYVKNEDESLLELIVVKIVPEGEESIKHRKK